MQATAAARERTPFAINGGDENDAECLTDENNCINSEDHPGVSLTAGTSRTYFKTLKNILNTSDRIKEVS